METASRRSSDAKTTKYSCPFLNRRGASGLLHTREPSTNLRWPQVRWFPDFWYPRRCETFSRLESNIAISIQNFRISTQHISRSVMNVFFFSGDDCEWEGIKGKCVHPSVCLTTLDKRGAKPPVSRKPFVLFMWFLRAMISPGLKAKRYDSNRLKA